MIVFRIIYAVLFIAAFVFSSFYGGYVPEFIRYTLMCVPALLLIYLCVVYMRMRQKQTIQDMFIVKGEPVDYTFTVKNRDIIPYLDLRVHFYENTADISILEQASRLDILPFSTISFKGKIVCKYAGVYNVGVNTIEIPDFFHVFRLKYRCRKPVKVHVRPRKIHITSIKSCISAKNNRNPYGHYVIGNDVCGSSIRNYIPGDSMKMIHWKNTAKIHELVTKQNEEVFEENPFMVSGALNINALQFDSQIRHAKKKIENGVSVLFTQPVLSERGFANLKRAREELDVKILGGIMPVVSYRNACFMNNEMAGIDVQDTIVSMYQDKNREEGEELAYRISTAIIDKITDYVDGYYLITPFKRVELLLRIIHYVKNKKNR